MPLACKAVEGAGGGVSCSPSARRKHNRHQCRRHCRVVTAAVLIGALPTYSQVGLAAPILLSLLRLVQGIAVGGELGTAVSTMCGDSLSR